jgi:AcrR family transcriptional regulator
MSARDPSQEPPPERILAAAADHVRRFGAARTTIVSVARETGMSHANVYRYFPSKEALFDEITADWLRRLEGELRDIADAPDPADDKLERILTAAALAYRATAQEDAEIFALFVAARRDERAAARKHAARLRTLIDRAVEEGAASGVFEIRDRARSVAFVIDAAHRFLDPRCVAAEPAVPRTAFDQRLGMVTRAINRQLAARWR